MAVNGITAQGTQNQRNLQTGEETRAPEKFLRPAVNIVEDETGLVLTADLPGATKDALEIHVDQGILTISAPVSSDTKGRPIYAEFEWAPYFRQFQIPDAIDQAKMRAEFKNGLLTLHLPKMEAAKPRRIEISVAS
jgi:HSP20 family molecular chaperone IbpA